jgi:hypothetical protein
MALEVSMLAVPRLSLAVAVWMRVVPPASTGPVATIERTTVVMIAERRRTVMVSP